MAGDTVARSVNKFIIFGVGGQIRWIYPPLNKPKTLAVIFTGTMKYTYYILTIIVFSCGTRNQGELQEEKETKSIDTLQTVTLNEPLKKKNSFGTITIESTIQGKDDKDFWETGLKVVEYKISRNDSILTTIQISPSDFSDLYNKDFSERSKIWESEILAVDEKKQRIAILNNFGLPESDNQSNVIVTVDFKGNRSYKDSPPDCSSGTNFSFNKIVDCEGVYDFEKPIFEFKDCCTVFSDLVNDSTLFYILDWGKEEKKNAFLININTMDTLDSFVFKDFYQALGYSAAIEINREMGILAILKSDKNELVTLDKSLTKNTYDLSTIRSVSDLTPRGYFIEIYSEDVGKIIIEFDESKKPIRWNK